MALPDACCCKEWVEATKCSGNTSSLRVFVHEDHLPASTSVFRYDSPSADDPNCWSIDPNGTRKRLPQGAHVYTGSFPYADCTECESDADDPDGEGGPGGGGVSDPGGAGGGGGPGPGGWPGPEGSTPMGIKVTVCADHVSRAQERGWDTDNLYIPASEEFDESFVGISAGICVQVPTGPVVEDPDPAYWIGVTGAFDSCSDCTDGAKATLCDDDQSLPGAENAPEIWVRKGLFDRAATEFEYGKWCYQLPDNFETLPENAFVLLPTKQTPCSTCNHGVQYERCAGEPDDGREYWARSQDIAALLETYPDLETVYVRINGICFSLDLTATPVRIPTSTSITIVPPRCGFLDCQSCKCGGTPDPACETAELGIPVRLCPHINGDGFPEVWLAEDAIPGEVTYFRYGVYCVYADPAETPRPIPVDAIVLRSVANNYNSCSDCPPNPPDDDGGGGGEPTPDAPPHEPPPQPGDCYFSLGDCFGGVSPNGFWVKAPCNSPPFAGTMTDPDTSQTRCVYKRAVGQQQVPRAVAQDPSRLVTVNRVGRFCSDLSEGQCGATPCQIRDNGGIPEVSFDGVEWIPLSTTYTVSGSFYQPSSGGQCSGPTAGFIFTAQWKRDGTNRWTGPVTVTGDPDLVNHYDGGTWVLVLAFLSGCSPPFCHWFVRAITSRPYGYKFSGSSPAGSYMGDPCGQRVDTNCLSSDSWQLVTDNSINPRFTSCVVQ